MARSRREFKANHSCGHDAHMTIVMGLILQLKNMRWDSGTVRFIFQPAEEKGNGSLKMVEKGAVDDADFLFGVHLRPIEELPLKQAATIDSSWSCSIFRRDDSWR